ncbi:MAG TPA: hypothetical protein VF056_05500 [Thermoleophilaceae bacterium]
MRPTATCLFACLGLLVGCASGDDDKPASSAEQQREAQSETPDGDAGAGPAPPPDAGTAAGHGADPARVVVPSSDATPPAATVALAAASDGRTLAEASQPGGGTHSATVELSESRLRGTTIGKDSDGGVSRVRISIAERITCQASDGRRFERLRTRYFPPPEVERIRAQPGVRLPTRLMRSRVLGLGGDRCGAGARPLEVHGALWGQAINSHGLEAVTLHIRFVHRR